jgi:DNA repair protein RadC
MQTSKLQLTPSQIKLSYQPPTNPIKINNPETAQQFFLSVWDKELINLQEQFYVAFVNANYEVICWRCINTGTVCSTSVDVKLIFSLALSCFARAIVVAHNHPSGNINPSKKDFQLTKQLKDGATILGLELADHLILGDGIFSFLEEGRL